MPVAATESDSLRVRIRRGITLFAAVANLAVIDQLAKKFAVVVFSNSPISVIPGFFDLAYVENRGCAWGMFQGHVWPLATFGLAALAFLIWRRKDVFTPPEKTRFIGKTAAMRIAFAAEALLYSGIVGNLADRIFRGFVVDFLDFHFGTSHFPCFNLADSYITIAVAALLALSLAAAEEKDGSKK